MIKANDLVGRAVLTLSDAARVGRVDGVLFDTELHHVLGFRVKTGRFSAMEAVARADVTGVGRDALTVASAADVNQLERVASLASSKALTDVVGTKVVSEGGDAVGTVATVELDDEARAVTGFVLSAAWWDNVRGHGPPVISAQRVVRLGDGGIMIVPNAVADSLRPLKTS